MDLKLPGGQLAGGDRQGGNVQYLIGVDEAGYGPNLGPLVIGATAWEVDSSVNSDAPFDLYDALSDCVRGHAVPRSCTDPRLFVADSKQVYSSGKGLDQLELGVLACLRSLEHTPQTWQELCETLSPQCLAGTDLPDWYAEFSQQIPVAVDESLVAEASERFATGCGVAGVRLRKIGCRVIFPQEFNTLVEVCGNKGALLSQASLTLVNSLIDDLDAESQDRQDEDARDAKPARRVRTQAAEMLSSEGDQQLGLMVALERADSYATKSSLAKRSAGSPRTIDPPTIDVVCDKHGGRNRYAGVLQHVFPECLPMIETEGARSSAYRLKLDGKSVQFRFEVGGERHLQIALASMAAKYVRETVMQAFNAFWRKHLPALRPTAGYPQDARRFLKEIGQLLKSLQIPHSQVWRER